MIIGALEANPAERMARWQLYFSVALISMSVLILEIAFTRIFSLMFEYHYVF
jgi:hypothetical protein